FVIKADSTPYHLAQRSIEALRTTGARLFGIVLNQLDFAKADRYYGAYTGSGDGYYTQPRSSLAHGKTLAAKRAATARAAGSSRVERIADSSAKPAAENPPAESSPAVEDEAR